MTAPARPATLSAWENAARGDASVVAAPTIRLLTGTEGDDVVLSTPGDDTVQGLGGDDTLVGSAGDDLYDGGAGTDLLVVPVARGDGLLLSDAGGTATGFTFVPPPVLGGVGAPASTYAFGTVETVGFLDGSRVEFLPGAAAVQVTHLYRFALGRDPDAFGLATFALRLGRDGSEAVARALVDSPEGRDFPRLAIVGEEVDRAYGQILGRAPAPDERAFWVAQDLDDGALAARFLGSDEYAVGATGIAARGVAVSDAEAVLVARGYDVLLGRPPDLAGAAASVAALKLGGATLDAVYGDLAASPEFAATRGGPLADEAYVDLLYQEALGRGADAAGRDFWAARLASGEDTRGGVAATFVTSAEGAAALQALAASGVDLL